MVRPVKKQKLLIAKAIQAYREGRPHYQVANIPHICVEPGTMSSKKRIEADEPHIITPAGFMEIA